MGFGQGLSGLNAASQNLDVIGNNIANSGTVGFKAATATFADVYASSRVGLGTQVASINQRFTVGNVSSTGNQFDMAIDGAKGLFRVIDQSGNVLYTRNGQFSPDKDFYLVNAQGYRLTGFPEGSTTPQPIRVPVGNVAPTPTSTIELRQANLDANSPVIDATGSPAVPGSILLDDGGGAAAYGYTLDTAGNVVWTATPPDGTYTSASGDTVVIAGGAVTSGPLPAAGTGETAFVPAIAGIAFDPGNPDSFTHSLPITVYDSLGNPHQLMQYFAKRDGTPGTASNWDVYYLRNGVPVDVPAGGGPVSMSFDSTGRLTSPVGTTTVSITQPGGTASPAAPLNIALSYAGATSFGGEFNAPFTQNGYRTGEYASMSISADGTIVANYTNGETRAMGSLALADFNNLQGLRPVGGNAWAETGASGQPSLGRPGSNGLATIKGQAVEESNVDMSQELVNMIIAQRTYQANAQTIKTQDQILQTLITLR